jgi:tRNA(Ile)-lysidine synthase
MKKYVVAVSGGVDSVVLLDIMARKSDQGLIVAHFDHGIRQESAEDAAFVAALAQKYKAKYVTKRMELGPDASEEMARTNRYRFLKEVAEKEGAELVTAHHADDVVESIVINIVRGTGWRGLAVFGDTAIVRPLLAMRKQQLYEYACSHGLEWVEDATNLSDAYLRNRIRRSLTQLPSSRRAGLIQLWQTQRQLADDIDREVSAMEGSSRHFLTMVDEASALELLRGYLAKYSLALTRPQRRQLLHAIKTARPGTTLEAGGGVYVRFTLREFIVKYPL